MRENGVIGPVVHVYGLFCDRRWAVVDPGSLLGERRQAGGRSDRRTERAHRVLPVAAGYDRGAAGLVSGLQGGARRGALSR